MSLILSDIENQRLQEVIEELRKDDFPKEPIIEEKKVFDELTKSIIREIFQKLGEPRGLQKYNAKSLRRMFKHRDTNPLNITRRKIQPVIDAFEKEKASFDNSKIDEDDEIFVLGKPVGL